jgi:2-polyprenyl-3-methyl-5-hydroxy-6-metoxy-1,4-benzoquinol methylase
MTEPSELYKNYLSTHLAHVTNPDVILRKKEWYIHNHAKWLPTDRSAKILDIGPGFGELIELLVSEYSYKDVHAIDISQEVVETCNKLLANSTELVTNTTKYLQSKTNTFDCIFLFHVLEHIPKSETVEFLQAVHGALRINGRIIIEVPNMANPITGLNVRYADFTHEVGFTNLSLEYVLRKSNFDEIMIFPCRVPTTSLKRWLQFLWQTQVELLIKNLLMPYMPTKPNILSFVLGATAIKQR